MAGVADQVFLRRIAGGVELVTGGKQVLLMGADIAKLDLFANLAGVTSVSFVNDTAGGVRSLRGTLMFDGLVHVNELIASNYGDWLIGGAWKSVLRGGAGRDTLVVTGTGYYMDGGAGVDTVSYLESDKGVVVNLMAGSDDLGSTLVNIENVTGSVGTTGSSGPAAPTGWMARLARHDRWRWRQRCHLFGRGYGVDTVQNGVAANGGPSSRIILGANLRPSDLWFERQGNDLWVRILVRTTPWSSRLVPGCLPQGRDPGVSGWPANGCRGYRGADWRHAGLARRLSRIQPGRRPAQASRRERGRLFPQGL